MIRSGWRETIELAQGLAEKDRAGDRDIERAQAGTDRDRDPCIGGFMHMIRDAGGFAAKKDDVACQEGECVMRDRAPGRCEHEPMPPCAPPFLEMGERDMAANIGMGEIIEPGAPEVAVARVKPCGFDKIDRHAKAGAEPEQGARILRNVRLVERQADRRPASGFFRLIDHCSAV